jgi:hypothetical protein
MFSPLNINHTTSTIASILGSISLIPDGDEIIIDIIVSSSGKAHLLIHNFPAR